MQEVDPTTAGASTPVGTVAGQVDMSRQLFDLSRPGMDGAITEDLGRAHGTAIDAQIVAGSGSGQNMRGLLNVSGILSVTGAVTNVQTFREALTKSDPRKGVLLYLDRKGSKTFAVLKAGS